MKRLKNKKGFTLVELLVAISILGIIMIIAIPQLGNIQSSNKKTKYVKYAESMLTSAKLYTDSYTEDMFGNNKSGCVDIAYTELKEKDLVKDIKIDQTNCNSENTFVQVLKTNDHYIYGVSVSCKNQNNEVVYEKTIPKCGENGPDETGPTITITSNLNTETWDYGINKTATISITDSYGMLENTKFQYYWTKGGELVGEKKTHDYKNKRYEGSSAEGSSLSYTIDIPQNKTGKYVLHVEPVDVRDANGNYQTHAVTKGEFYLDNTAPTVPDVSTYKWVDNNDSSAPTSTTGLSGYTADTWSTKNIYSVAANSTDGDAANNAGEVYYQYTTTGVTTNETNQNGTTRNIKAEGESTIKYRACDAIDNCSEYTDPITIKVDKTAPTLSDPTNSSNSSWTNQNVVIKATASDSVSGIASTYYNYDNTTTTSNTDWDAGSTLGSVTGTWKNQRDDSVYIVVKDNAGNITKKSAGMVRIDKTPPTLSTPTNSSNGNWTNKSVVIKATASDLGGSGLASTYYNYDNTTTTSKTDWDDGSSASSVTGTWTANRDDTVYIVAKDNAGNTTKLSAGKVRIDTTKPTCGTMSVSGTAGSNGWYRSDVTISKSDGSDTGGSGHNSTTISHTSIKTETTGTTVTLTTTDKAGNVCTDTKTIKIDKTAPTIAFSSKDNTKDGNTTLKSTYSLSDSVSGVARFCRSHCATPTGSGAKANYCISGLSAKERVEYLYNNSDYKTTTYDGKTITDNKSMCHDGASSFTYNTTFGTSITINYALIAIDAAGNVSSTYTNSQKP